MIGYKRIKPVQIIDEVNITNVEYDDTAEKSQKIDNIIKKVNIE